MLASLSFSTIDKNIHVKASGTWSSASYTKKEVEHIDQQEEQILSLIKTKNYTNLVLEVEDLKKWDSTLLSLYSNLIYKASEHKILINTDTLPEKILHLLLLKNNHPQEHNERRKLSLMEYLQQLWTKTEHVISFIGDVALAFLRLFRGKALFSSKDMWAEFANCSIMALPLISAIALLLGLILSFVTAYQLALFGAETFMASFLVIAITRVLGPCSVAVILAGRTGAAYAALIGSMQVNEEVDALATFGISPIDFLVLPKVLALAIMIPFLTMYGNAMSVLGGLIVGSLMGITPEAFYENMIMFTKIDSMLIGLLNSFVFGIIVAMTGCYQGLYCARSADGVGKATTAAVVNAIIGIIIATAVLTLIFTIK